MKFSCTKEHLVNALTKVNSLAGKNSTLPILNNILIKVDNQKSSLITTNLDIAISTVFRSKIETPGSFTVPAKTFFDIVNLFSDERIDLEMKENELFIECGKSKTKIKGVTAEDFPIIPNVEQGKTYSLGADLLKQGFSAVLSSTAKNDIRPELNGVFCGLNLFGINNAVFAATDSYRLAEKQIPISQGSEEFRMIIPGKTASEIFRIISGVTNEEEKQVLFTVNESQMLIEYGSTKIVSRLVEGNYPDYTQIIPKNFKTTALVSLEKITKEIKAAGLFTTTGINSIKLVFKPADEIIQLASTSTQAGEYTSEIPAEIEGQENDVLVSYRYLLEGLNNIKGEKVKLKIINGDSPCIITPENDNSFLYIVMPIRS